MEHERQFSGARFALVLPSREGNKMLREGRRKGGKEGGREGGGGGKLTFGVEKVAL